MRSICTRTGLLCVALTMTTMISASAAMALKIKPFGDTIQLKATNMKLLIWGKEPESTITCELWQTSGKISALGTLPVSLEVPIFGIGKGECTIPYAGTVYKGSVTSAEAEELKASSTTAASIGHQEFVIQLETGKTLDEECQLHVGESPYNGVWANGTSKEKPSTLTLSKIKVGTESRHQCALWGEFAKLSTLSATFSVTDTTQPTKPVVLE